MSKFLLLDQTVINLIVKSLLGANDVPDDLYTAGQTDWVGNQNPFVIYTPKNECDDRFIPVVVNIQNELCYISLSESIRYCTLVYEKYKALLTVLVISINEESNLVNYGQLYVDENSSFTRIKPDFWAKDYLVFP